MVASRYCLVTSDVAVNRQHQNVLSRADWNVHGSAHQVSSRTQSHPRAAPNLRLKERDSRRASAVAGATNSKLHAISSLASTNPPPRQRVEIRIAGVFPTKTMSISSAKCTTRHIGKRGGCRGESFKHFSLLLKSSKRGFSAPQRCVSGVNEIRGSWLKRRSARYRAPSIEWRGSDGDGHAGRDNFKKARLQETSLGSCCACQRYGANSSMAIRTICTMPPPKQDIIAHRTPRREAAIMPAYDAVPVL
jgi:hypothetical protein